MDISPTKFQWGRKQRETGGVGFAVPSGKKKKKAKVGWAKESGVVRAGEGCFKTEEGREGEGDGVKCKTQFLELCLGPKINLC